MAERYTYDQAAVGEEERLLGITALWDQGTRNALRAIPLRPGWRCLDVGAGGGSVTRWLAEAVGADGAVHATDLDTRFLRATPNTLVMRHDITGDEALPGDYDLVHARLVLSHLKDRDAVLAKLVSLCAPGGWLLVEEFDWPRRHPADGDRRLATYTRVNEAINDRMRANGYDPEYGRRLPLLLHEHGLSEIGTLLHGGLIRGGSAAAEFDRQAVHQLADSLVEHEGITRAEVDDTLESLADPEFLVPSPPLVSAWGRRPQ
ncbi:methyltransferase domain-containing protein [Allokutzneria sp. A3M-2-11 16]|uniref:class I SAM-dependent methyltransferase n=1 Tax=Allokutzneria sp. A3M-2-11 16 TaxID=2962043 RepID=UPI0020B8079E|nr:methyltransferase [Allokutzneria sp. A3M-2-11 16]MCP3802376.1 methyltransferase domain-containing protein [Allokutzneria sp. A3M-2-11 16]